MSVSTRPADNFFVIDTGSARYLGEKWPRQAKGVMGKALIRFAFILPRTGAPPIARTFLAADVGEALLKATVRVERRRIRKAVLGRPVGRLKGKLLFQDVAVLSFLKS